MRFVLPLLAAACAACTFGGGLPAGALLLCRSDTECPEGLKCDERHECRPPADDDGEGPALIAVRFEPAFARDGIAHLILESDTELDDAAPVLAFAGAEDPGFALEPLTSPTVRSFSVDVSTLAEGTWRLTRVTLFDRDGDPASHDIDDAALVVDRRAPTIRNLRAEDESGTEGTFSDTAGSNVLVAIFDASELVDSVEMTVGTLSTVDGAVTCAPNGALGFACTGTLTAALVEDGANDLEVRVRDFAGNEARASIDVLVDTAPPAPEQGTVTVSIEGPNGDPASALSNGGVLRISFVADEPLATAPVVVLDAGAVLSATLVSSSGRFYVYELVLVDVVPEGAYPLRVTMTDVFGHALVDAPLPLPTPYESGVPVSATIASTCTITTPTALECPDFDGDGQRGPPAAGCSSVGLVDCDDTDPTTYAGAFERPGDGSDNDCVGGDLPIDEDTGVFCSSDATAPFLGTRAQPFADFGEALAFAASTSKPYVFLSGNPACAGTACSVITSSVIGGMVRDFADDSVWTRGVGRSAPGFNLSTGVSVTAPGIIESLVISNNFAVSARATIINLIGPFTVSTSAPVAIVDSSLPRTVGFQSTAAGSTVVRTVMGSMIDSAPSVTLVEVELIDGVVASGGDITLVRSVSHARVSATNAVVSLVHSLVLPATGNAVDLSNSRLNVVNSFLRASAVAIDADATSTFALEGTLFDPTATELLPGVIPADVALLVADPRCLALYAVGVSAVTLQPTDAFHLDGVGGGAIDAGVYAFSRDDLPYRPPSSAARDIDGQCLVPGDAPDVGPDEAG